MFEGICVTIFFWSHPEGPGTETWDYLQEFPRCRLSPVPECTSSSMALTASSDAPGMILGLTTDLYVGATNGRPEGGIHVPCDSHSKVKIHCSTTGMLWERILAENLIYLSTVDC